MFPREDCLTLLTSFICEGTSQLSNQHKWLQIVTFYWLWEWKISAVVRCETLVSIFYRNHLPDLSSLKG